MEPRGEVLHQAAARGNQPQRIFERENPGEASGHVFADAVAHHGAGPDAPGKPELGKRIFEGEDRGLRVEVWLESWSCRLLAGLSAL